MPQFGQNLNSDSRAFPQFGHLRCKIWPQEGQKENSATNSRPQSGQTVPTARGEIVEVDKGCTILMGFSVLRLS